MEELVEHVLVGIVVRRSFPYPSKSSVQRSLVDPIQAGIGHYVDLDSLFFADFVRALFAGLQIIGNGLAGGLVKFSIPQRQVPGLLRLPAFDGCGPSRNVIESILPSVVS